MFLPHPRNSPKKWTKHWMTKANKKIQFSFQSLSTGVFIYITFMSLIPDEYQRSQQNEGNIKMSIKIFAFTTGWSILVLLSLIASH